jgi:hypothetical protein
MLKIISLHLSKREVCFGDHQFFFILTMELVICWSISYYQNLLKNIFLLEREISNLFKIRLKYTGCLTCMYDEGKVNHWIYKSIYWYRTCSNFSIY